MKIETFPTSRFMMNCYLVFDENTKEAVIVDPGEEIPELDQMVKELTLHVSKILLTHGHYDHIGNVQTMRERYACPVGASKKEEMLLMDPRLNLSSRMGREECRISCEEYYEEGDTISPFSITMLSTPGHTAGCCCYDFGEFVITGDTLFRGSVGRWDFPTSSYEDLLQSLKKLFRLEESKRIYPGHGASSTIAREKRENPFYQPE